MLPVLTGKSTISMAIFNSFFVSLPEGNQLEDWGFLMSGCSERATRPGFLQCAMEHDPFGDLRIK